MHRPDLNQHKNKFQNSTIIKTGLSDFHKLTVTEWKCYYRKLKPKKLIYRDFKDSSNQQFWTELVKELNERNLNRLTTNKWIFVSQWFEKQIKITLITLMWEILRIMNSFGKPWNLFSPARLATMRE